MAAIQLEIFRSKEDCELQSLYKAYEDISISSDKVRKGTYAKINELNKECLDLKQRLEILEKHICKSTIMLT